MADINIFALGGQDENGKNSFVIENNNDIYLINAGIKIPVNNLNGIDGIIPDFNYLINKKDRIKGVFITHANDEVFAALPWLIMEIPGLTIYLSQYTFEIVKERISKYKLGHNDFTLKVLDKDQKIGDINIKTYELANSVPGSIAFNLQTKDGDIIFMSNNTIDDLGVFGKTDLENIKENSNNILALLLDSRRSNYKGHSSDMKSVIPSVKEMFEKAKPNERIIVGSYDEYIHSIQEIIELAKKEGRPVISYGRTFDNHYSKIKGLKSNQIPKFENYKNINKINNAVVFITGTPSRLYQRFVRIALGDDVFIKFKENDNIIMICPPVNGMEVTYANSLDHVARVAPNILDVSDKDFYQLRPASDDIKKIVSTLKPKHFIPMSGLYRYLVVSSQLAIKSGVMNNKSIVLQNGRIMHLKDGELVSSKHSIKEYGDVIIDGFGIGDVSYEVIRERENLATGGLVSISLQIDRRTKQILGEINIQILGIVIKSELKEAQDLVRTIVIQKIESINPKE